MLSSTNLTRVSAQEQLDRVFKALGDRTRRDLLVRLSEGPAKVTDLAKPFAMSLPAVGKHLRILERAGLMEHTITGRVHRCAPNPLPLKHADESLQQDQQFRVATLDALSTYLQRETSHEKSKE